MCKNGDIEQKPKKVPKFRRFFNIYQLAQGCRFCKLGFLLLAVAKRPVIDRCADDQEEKGEKKLFKKNHFLS